MKNSYRISIILCSCILLTGCSTQKNAATEKSRSAQNTSNVSYVNEKLYKVSKSKLIEVKNPKLNSLFSPVAYNSSLGFLSTTPAMHQAPPGAPPLPFQNKKFIPGRIMELKNGKYLPQIHPIKGYEPYDVQSNKDWITWIYVSFGLGPDLGEKIYAYNIKKHSEFLVWSGGPLQQVFEYQLQGHVIYYGIQYNTGSTDTTFIRSINLTDRKNTLIVSTKGTGFQNVIEDFAVTGKWLGVIETPANHFTSPSLKEKYHFEIGTTKNPVFKTIYSNVNVNPFTLRARSGVWVWSDKTRGVTAYVLGSKQVLGLDSMPSYVKTDGQNIWWVAINSNNYGGYDIKSNQYLKLPPKVIPLGINISGNVDIFDTKSTFYFYKSN
ncbi:hypothetical protein [Alicyclobacillus tolerans]|uniref:Lipoprotein n=1 Tax=Alicyclobacillus tolerans TaxID=90970 RepID=A0A1M6XVP7_9BACL|nr:hypothetical protein [Alicyclobacillus montanus]SHL10092.1 hypothetical protein SAMN05443507_1387 [Alicyclobacillus montanus]